MKVHECEDTNLVVLRKGGFYFSSLKKCLYVIY